MPLRFISTITFLLIFSSSALAASDPKAVHEQAAKAIAAEAAAQETYEQWTDNKESLAAEIRDMKAMNAWLQFQNQKYEKYLRKQEAVIAELERRKQEARRIRMELEPFLETVVDDLEKFVAGDLPFFDQERAGRIRFLRASLDDYHLDLSEKLRRVVEALQVETEYGRSVSTTASELEINGTPTRVSIFRLGRTALFYRTADGSGTGVWDRNSKTWRPLDESFGRTLKQASDMADRKRAVELLYLPMGARQ